MIAQFLKNQYRIIRNRKIFYAVNVFGLALGIASAILIMLWIADEMGYEKMHANAGRIKMVHKQYIMGDDYQVNNSLPMPLAQTLEDELPEISKAIRVVPYRSVR